MDKIKHKFIQIESADYDIREAVRWSQAVGHIGYTGCPDANFIPLCIIHRSYWEPRETRTTAADDREASA